VQSQPAGKSVHLPDGRRLSYAEWGVRSGVPIFFLHGTPGSRLLTPPVSVTSELGVRLVTFDRPGYGCSDPWPKRRLREWTSDVAALANALSVRRFGVIGASGGGPHALACAALLADRVTAVAVVSSPAPPFEKPDGLDAMDDEDRGILKLAVRDVDAARERMEKRGQWIRDLAAHPDSLLEGVDVEADRRTLADPGVQAMTSETLRESLRQDLEGYAWDWLAIRLPWGFRIEEARSPVHVWHGAADRNVPLRDGAFIASRLPDARVTHWPDEGHWGFLVRWREILDALVTA
jgi:pimeloyl-ACP methyl ester carboxylesterase